MVRGSGVGWGFGCGVLLGSKLARTRAGFRHQGSGLRVWGLGSYERGTPVVGGLVVEGLGLGCYSEASLSEPVQVGHVSISAFCNAPARGIGSGGYRGTSLMRNYPPSQDHHRGLDICLL